MRAAGWLHGIEHRSMVRQLEQLYDAQQPEDPSITAAPAHPASQGFDAGDLPSMDELAAEVERFLRDQESE